MNSAHYISLIASYGTACGLWFLLNRLYPNLWTYDSAIPKFKKPWLEFVIAIMAILLLLAIGQLYVNDYLITVSRESGMHHPLDALNQIIIYAPIIIVVLIRKHSLNTVWLPKTRIFQRLGIGFLISVIALFIYTIIRQDAKPFLNLFTDIYNFKNLSYIVQVFLEDLTIAFLFIRLSALIGYKLTIGIVASLFAAGHIPGMISNGANLVDLASLLADTFLGLFMLIAISRSRDIWWFFVLHFTLDMTQFYAT